MERFQVCLQVVRRRSWHLRYSLLCIVQRPRLTRSQSVDCPLKTNYSLGVCRSCWPKSCPGLRSEQPVSGANKIAAMQSILQYKFSPGFDKLEEELRKFEGLVKTYHAVFGEGISDSIAQAVIKSQMPAEIRTHLELQTFTRTTELISLMSSLSKTRTQPPARARQHTARYRRRLAGSRTTTRARTRRKGKEKARAKERAVRNPRTRSSKGGVATAENGVTKLQTVGTEMRNRSTKFRAKLARPD